MKKHIYKKPSFTVINIVTNDLCVGSQCGGIDVTVIHRLEESRKTHYKFERNQTIEDNMWNPKF